MVAKLVVNYDKCVGCETCEQACSLKRGGMITPALSRIGVIRRNMGAQNVPITCQQCESAPCMAICPVKAISHDEKLGRKVIDYNVCIGCRMCVAICPFGAMQYEGAGKKVFKCDLCDGDPVCVKFCQHDALKYFDAAQQGPLKQIAIAEKVSGIINKIASAMANIK